ncbi:hypothetical protein K1719_039094 [Acacia pycnantha]|nr:hypothetical protein K1719_039094 [Acacia pycnantha]
MAEQIPYGVASSLINTLASLAFKEIASIYGVKSEIEWLKHTVEAIKVVFADADHKQHLTNSSSSGSGTSNKKQSEKEIIDLLLNTSSNENVSLVAIVGIGGLGKTALAQLEVNSRQLELLQDELEENLKGQRYLLVLDDVWNEDREKWLHLKKYLMCGVQGSKILLTTRNQTVAKKMGVKTPYLLKELTNHQSWILLRSLAFDEDKIITQKLESIGQKIAEKCAGVPLAIRVMGSLLQSKSRQSDWEAILEGDFWKSCEGDNSIMPILKLSYDNLAIELKQCFAYCSLYPKDWEYEKDELIDLWMAHSFLEYDGERQCPEDIGEEYVRILLMKSFLQDVEKDGLGEIKSFKMHDLMHDLCQLIASSDYCLYVEGRKM